MENVVEALKVAFAIMMFCLALSLSISSFTETRIVAASIIEAKDRETEYTYIEPTSNLTRTVGVGTIVPAMYRAYRENIEIYFLDKQGNPLILYNKKDRKTGEIIEVNYVNFELEDEDYGSLEEAIEHLNILMSDTSRYNGIYKEQIIHSDGLYKELSKYTFEEKLGEYYQGSGTSKIKKRVITYTIQ